VVPVAWPTTDNPRTEFVTTRFTVDEAADIDWLIAHTGAKNRSAALRNAVDRVVAAEKKRAARQKKQSAPGPRVLDTDDEQDGVSA
jgi:hypothetical protein